MVTPSGVRGDEAALPVSKRFLGLCKQILPCQSILSDAEIVVYRSVCFLSFFELILFPSMSTSLSLSISFLFLIFPAIVCHSSLLRFFRKPQFRKRVSYCDFLVDFSVAFIRCPSSRCAHVAANPWLVSICLLTWPRARFSRRYRVRIFSLKCSQAQSSGPPLETELDMAGSLIEGNSAT